MQSMYLKNFMVSAGLIVASFVFFGITVSMLLQYYVTNVWGESMELSASEVALSATAFVEDDSFRSWELKVLLTTLEQTTGNDIMITNDKGYIVACSDDGIVCHHIGAKVEVGTLDNLISQEKASGVSNLGGIFDTPRVVVAEPIISSGETIGYTIVSDNVGRLSGIEDTFSALMVLITLVVLTITVIITFITTKKQTNPINQMASAAMKFSHGDFSVRIEDTGRNDELGALTNSFNLMADSLEQSEQKRREFIANVSHELKTPMTTISGFADGILDGTIPTERQNQYLNTISSETKRLNRMVKRMLELSRIQAEDTGEVLKKSFDIGEVLMQTLLSLEGRINERKLDVDVCIPEERCLVKGDGDAINQVVYNLLENAIKFSKEGEVLGLSLWKQANKVYVSIKNRGETIPPQQLSLIFDRFHKTDASRSQDRDGVGLGLYIVKTILGNHREDISVSSVNGVTEFVFTLTPKKN